MSPRRLLPLGLAASLLVACAGGPGGRTLSFADVQSLNPGVSGDWILEEYPFARRVDRWPNGRVRSLDYPVTDPLGKSQSLSLGFDANGVLATKQYSGPIVKPPIETTK